MAARFTATSVNTVVLTSDNSVAQNARIVYDAAGWVVNTTNGTLSDGTEKRRVVKGPGLAGNQDVGVEYNYVDAQKRTVKQTNDNDTRARLVFSPSHL